MDQFSLISCCPGRATRPSRTRYCINTSR